MTPSIPENLVRIAQRIQYCERAHNRPPGSVRLIAVSKTQPASSIRLAHACGQRDFGENYLQEALGKQSELDELPLCWHFIGPIQSNKTRELANRFDWVHSVDREKIARRLSEQRSVVLGPLNILLQVNIGDESSKSGVSVDGLPALADCIQRLPNLVLKGLMSIPAPERDRHLQRRNFRLLADAARELRSQGHEHCLELSMGMSADFEAAIAEGATMVRIGTDIFGSRNRVE